MSLEEVGYLLPDAQLPVGQRPRLGRRRLTETSHQCDWTDMWSTEWCGGPCTQMTEELFVSRCVESTEQVHIPHGINRTAGPIFLHTDRYVTEIIGWVGP